MNFIVMALCALPILLLVLCACYWVLELFCPGWLVADDPNPEYSDLDKRDGLRREDDVA